MSVATSSRIRSLDGLRGIAAVVVLLAHALALTPELAVPHVTASSVDPGNLVAWAMWHTPLHLLWAGPEAVYVFFILSGIVLTLPVLRSKRFDWRSYYPKRLVRLYIPVIGAVLLASASLLFFPRFIEDGDSVFLEGKIGLLSASSIAKDASLLFGISGNLGVLWSLRWEVLFSLMLPLYVFSVGIWAKGIWIKFAVILVLIGVGGVATQPVLFYMPMFAVGSLIASELDRIQLMFKRLSKTAWRLLALAAVLLTSSYWMVMPFWDGWSAEGAFRIPVFLGTVLIVMLGAFWGTAVRFLNLSAIQWLGRISFSLYLVHEPVVVTLGFALGSHSSLLAGFLSIVLSVLLAWAFFHLVEAPSHTLSVKVGRAIGQTRGETPGT